MNSTSCLCTSSTDKGQTLFLLNLPRRLQFLISIFLAYSNFSSVVSPCMSTLSKECIFRQICCSVSLYSSLTPRKISDLSRFLFSIRTNCHFSLVCSTVSCCTHWLRAEFSLFSWAISVVCTYSMGLFSTIVLSELCMPFMASLIEVLMMLDSRSSIADISLSLVSLILAVNHNYILLISFNIWLESPIGGETLMVDMLVVIPSMWWESVGLSAWFSVLEHQFLKSLKSLVYV